MEIYVLNEACERIGVVDIYSSLLWAPSYNQGGTWELRCPMQYFALLQAERIIQNTEDDKHNGLIEHIEKVTDDDGVESLMVKGRMLEALLERRIIWNPKVYESVQPAQIAAELITENMICPADAARKLNVIMGGMPDSDEGIVSYSASGSLSKAVLDLCQEAGLGLRIFVEENGEGFVCDLYKGVNRTEEDNIQTAVETVSITNLLRNGEFSNGLTGWNQVKGGINYKGEAVLSVVNGMMVKHKLEDRREVYENNVFHHYEYFWMPSGYLQQTVNLVASHMYYLAVTWNNQTDSVVGFGIKNGEAATFMADKGAARQHALFVPEHDGKFEWVMGMGELAEKEGQYIYADSALLVDLTAAFGAGNEPTLEYCRDNIYYSGGWKYKRQKISLIPNAVDPLVFSRERDTLIEVEYTKNIVNERNVILVQGDGMNTVVQAGSPTGYLRKETCIDVKSSLPRQRDEVTIPDASYQAMLQREGKSTLRKMVVSELVDGKYYLLSNKRYRRDFDLGDIVNCVDRTVGFEVSLRITSTTEVWDAQGYSLALTFGDDIPDIYDIIQLVDKGAK